MTPQEIIAKAESFGSWYHRIELTPGYFTKSRMEGSYHIWDMVRRVRRNLFYPDKCVLDIGTMDGMWAFEAEAAGATCVFGADIWQGDASGEDRCSFALAMKKSGIQLKRWDAERLTDFSYREYFDIIQCLGMLYHVENPIKVLREIRACIRPHGEMLLETACYRAGNEDIPIARLNTDDGIYNDKTTFWVPNKKALLDMLKLTGWKPLEGSIQTSDEPRSYRICMICQPI